MFLTWLVAPAFLFWFYTAAKRAGLKHPAHAVSCWFVPAVNLFVPCAIALQLAAAAHINHHIINT